jgi:hypothetical protein
MTWHPGKIYEAWKEFHRALLEAMKPLPRPTLAFLASRANDQIIRSNAADILDWLDNRMNLPDWGWALGRQREGLRCAQGALESEGLERAVELARQERQLVVWDLAERPWAIAVYQFRTKELHPLKDEEAAVVLNRDPMIRREWRRWNAMHQNHGSLIVLDVERVRKVLEPDEAFDADVEGLA